jgi:hypothetical protein
MKQVALVLLVACFLLVSCLAYSSTLKMGATFPSKSSVDFQLTIRRCIPEYRTLQFRVILKYLTTDKVQKLR